MGTTQEWQPVQSRNQRKRMRTSSGEESDVERVSPHTQTTQNSEVPQGKRQGFPKFKALPSEGTTSYAMVAKLEKDWPALRSQVTARPNVYGQWVITPRTEEAFNTLSQTCFTQLRPEEKITKYILLHYPMEMSLCHIQAVDGGTESNPMHDQRWISHKTGGGASNRSQEGASRPRTMGAFQTAPLHRGTNEVLQMPAILAPQSYMSQPRVLCNLQRQTRDKCLHKQAQGGTSYNGAMHKLRREPSCMESQMPRTSETDSDRTTPGHNPAKKRKSSYTEEADNFGDCPLNIRNVKNRLLCGNIKRSSQASANSQAPKGEKATKAKKSHQHCRAAIKSRCGGKFPQGEERPSTSREVDGEGKGQSRNKENGFCTNTDISCASTSKGDPNPRKGKKGVYDTNFTSEDPGHIGGRGLQFVRTPTCRNDADLRHCTGSATQHNAANRTGQERNESHSQCLKIPNQDQRRQDKETEQNVNQSGCGHEHINGDNRPLKILKWNLNSFNAKRSFLMATAYSEQMDIILLQETRIKLGHTPKVRGYRVFSEPEIPQQSRGCMILVKNDISCAKIEELILCGEGVETQA